MNTVNDPLILKYSGSVYSVNKPGNQDGEYVDHEIAKELLEASEQLIEAMNQKNFFMEGYANGSASISEVSEFSAREHEAYSKLFDVIKKAKGQ